MAGTDLRNLAVLFGLVSALLLIIAALVDFVGGFVFLALGSGGHALSSWARSVVYVVVGLLFGLFAAVGRSGGSDRRVGAGVILVVLSVLCWVALGFGGELLALLAVVFALISGILFLVAAR